MRLEGPEAGVTLGLGQRPASFGGDPIASGSRGTTGSKACRV